MSKGCRDGFCFGGREEELGIASYPRQNSRFAVDVQVYHLTFNIQVSTFNIQVSIFNIQHLTSNIQHSSFKLNFTNDLLTI